MKYFHRDLSFTPFIWKSLFAIGLIATGTLSFGIWRYQTLKSDAQQETIKPALEESMKLACDGMTIQTADLQDQDCLLYLLLKERILIGPQVPQETEDDGPASPVEYNYEAGSGEFMDFEKEDTIFNIDVVTNLSRQQVNGFFVTCCDGRDDYIAYGLERTMEWTGLMVVPQDTAAMTSRNSTWLLQSCNGSDPNTKSENCLAFVFSVLKAMNITAVNYLSVQAQDLLILKDSQIAYLEHVDLISLRTTSNDDAAHKLLESLEFRIVSDVTVIPGYSEDGQQIIYFRSNVPDENDFVI